MPKKFDYLGAKKAGYSDEKIAQYLTEQKAAGNEFYIDRNEVQSTQAELTQVQTTEISAPTLNTASVSASQTPSPSPLMQGARITDRPTMSDVVRPTAKTYGPGDEMRSMTLIEFRRLGQGAGDAARRLLDKFQHLQNESYTVWAEALKGWRESDIYQLYLSIGRESMERGVPIAQVIADLGRTGKPYLSEHEFTVLTDLNRQLQT